MSITKASDIAKALGKDVQGSDFQIIKPADLAECCTGDLVWVKSFTPARLQLLEHKRPALVICDEETAQQTTVPCISSSNPRLDFIKALDMFFNPRMEPKIHPKAEVSPLATIGNNVSIGAFACIGPEVVIGDDCSIGSGVSIEGPVTLGNRCRIKSNSAIGGQGFGFEYDDFGVPIHFPHLGRIVIEDDVWIGACSTVEIASLGATRICSGCKIDDLVQVGHNVTVEKNTLVMANVVICGGAIIGEKCWIAPNSVIKQKVKIGNGVTLGLGAVVLKDVPDGLVVAGVPAKPLTCK